MFLSFVQSHWTPDSSKLEFLGHKQQRSTKPAKEVAMVWLNAKAHQSCPSWGFWARFFQMSCVGGFWGVRWTTFSSWIAEAGNQHEEPTHARLAAQAHMKKRAHPLKKLRLQISQWCQLLCKLGFLHHDQGIANTALSQDFPTICSSSEDLAFKRRKIGELQHPFLEVKGFLTLLFTRSFSLFLTLPS